MSWLGRLPRSVLKRALDPIRELKLRRYNSESTLAASSEQPVNSPSQARYLILLFASILHAVFFALMGSSLGFKAVLAAYAVSSFARANLVGKRT